MEFVRKIAKEQRDISPRLESTPLPKIVETNGRTVNKTLQRTANAQLKSQ